MAKYVRKRTFGRYPKGRRFKSKKRVGYKRKAVTMQMLRRVVPKPELKYHNIVNGVTYNPNNTFVALSDFNDVFLIAQGTQLGQRVGDKILLKKLTLEFETIFNGAATAVSVATGPAGAGTATAVIHCAANEAVRLVICDQNWNISAGTPQELLELMGSSQGNSVFGQSDYNTELDYNSLKGKSMHVYKDRKIVHFMGQATASGLPVGMPRQAESVKIHRIQLTFPGKGKLIQYDSNATQHPVRQPTMWLTGMCDAAVISGNPGVRLRVARAWYTDA